jgi:Protein of unknown function (DUF1676).
VDFFPSFFRFHQNCSPFPFSEKSGRALNDQLEENEILNSADAEKRETALETFTYNKAANFFQERSLQWDLKPVVTEVVSAARGMMDSVPADLKSKVSEFVEEGELPSLP